MPTSRMKIYQLENSPEDGTVILRYLGFQTGTPPCSGDFIEIIVNDEDSIFTSEQRPLGCVVNVIHAAWSPDYDGGPVILVLVSQIIGQLGHLGKTQDLVVKEIIPGFGISDKPGPDYRIN